MRAVIPKDTVNWLLTQLGMKSDNETISGFTNSHLARDSDDIMKSKTYRNQA